MNYRPVLQFALALFLCLGAGIRSVAEVVINEVHYDPPVKTELAEFVELHNSGTAAVDLSGWQFTAGIGFTFPAGTTLTAGGYLVVAENPSALNARFGVASLGPWSGLLANDGETVTLRNAAGEVVDEVDYQLGFPWPTVGDQPGYSMELVNPGFDNDLGGSWRASVRGNPNAQAQVLVPERSAWRYHKGNSEASSPVSAWRELAFTDNSWAQSAAPFGYGNDVPMGTTLNDMRGNYASIYLRRNFQVDDPAAIGSLAIEVLYDDGVQIWINGQKVVNAGMPNRDVAYNELASGPTRESGNYDEFSVNNPASFLRQGENVIAVQLHNIFLSESSDAFVDVKVSAQLGSPNAGPTPGARNAVYDANIPPHIRQVEHLPEQPKSGEPVRITAKITDPDGVSTVRLSYQVVDPGDYIELNDAAYEASWTTVNMVDDGTGGDQFGLDGTYTVTLPGSLQSHRRLVRYRIEAVDGGNRSIRAPYLDDPCPNFAYFVYNGVPGWQGAVRPGSTSVQAFSAEEMGRLPTYHLIARRSAVEEATWFSKYGGDLYRWWGTLVYEGKVYDHIRYRARGGVWRYAMGKNMWKFDFNRGHDFQAKNNYGEEYNTKWRKLNLGANIQQGNFEHRGEQGMFESVGFRLFNMAGVESPKTHWVNYRIIDEAAEAGPAQYNSDYWGLYLAIEQEDGRFLDEHGLPDGNLYKMEGGTGELNNQGRTAVTDKSDLNTFLNTYRNTTPTIAWWRQNADLHKIYSYHSIVEAIHHYDICFGKNYFYFLNPETGQWAIHTWDLDLTWADNMYGASCDDIRDHIITRSPFDIEYRNRVREIRDLLINTDQAWKVIDEYALIVQGTNSGPNILAADRAMWDYNPVMVDGSIVNPGKAGHGLFYDFSGGTFEGVPISMKDYIVQRSALLDTMARDNAIPNTPTLTYTGAANYPLNRIELRSSPFSGGAAFAAIKWRVGEIRTAAPGVPGRYEIEHAWESPEITTFNEQFTIPAEALRVGRTYRARVRMKDSTGRWSHWSAPMAFTASEPDNSAALQQYLKVTEIMYNPPAGSDFEFLELRNTSTNLTLELGGATFVEGIDFIFPAGARLEPNQFALVVQAAPANNFSIFRQHYNLDANGSIFGPYDGSLNNDGEQIRLQTAAAGAVIFSFEYNDAAGWPIAGDGTGHSIEHSSGSYEYGRNWIHSSRIDGSPLAEMQPEAPPILINEIAAHTVYSNPSRPEYDSNDWVELYNPGTSPDQAVVLRDYYLSDDAGDLAKWRLPDTSLEPGTRISFDEVSHFHNPVTTGFGIDQAGEEIYLTRFSEGAPVSVVDAVRFDAQESGFTYGRHPDGGEFYYTLNPTRDAANVTASRTVVISEFLYHPSGDTNLWEEYIELYNPTSGTLALYNTNGPYRVRGGISFDLPADITIPESSAVVLVSFDPANAADATRFENAFGLQNSSVVLVGPFIGRLGNSSDRITIEKPGAADLPGEPLVWITLDEVIYSDSFGADGTSESLHRVDANRSGVDPANFVADEPTPGSVAANPSTDQDNDGMPDAWEIQFGLDMSDPADAALDRDNDGLSNLAEFRAGTDPASAASRLALEVFAAESGATISVNAVAGKTYSVFYSDDLGADSWQKLRDLSGDGTVIITDPAPSEQHRYYRIITPAQP